LQLLAIDGQPVAVGQRYGKLQMRLGGAQAEQAAPDDRLAQLVGKLHLEQARLRVAAQLVGQCLVQQQFNAPPAACFVLFGIGQALGAAQAIMLGHLKRSGMALRLGDQRRAACRDQPNRGLEYLGKAHVEPDAAGQQLDRQGAAEHDQ
jgi:hypothetical protein